MKKRNDLSSSDSQIYDFQLRCRDRYLSRMCGNMRYTTDLYELPMTASLTSSQRKALKEIVDYIRRERLPPGTHLPAWTLAKLIGTSRSPVKVALQVLVDSGLLRYDRNKGYHVDGDIENIPLDVSAQLAEVDDPLYMRLADARFDGQIPESVTEADLVRLLGAGRSEISRILNRAHNEGWAEKEVGYGWRFLPMIDSVEAYDEMYYLRLAVEPAGILNPNFKPDLAELRALRAEQEELSNGGYHGLTTIERFESNARFHETIVRWSGNRFAMQALRRLDRIRRFAEYRQARNNLPRKVLHEEHLLILDAIESGDNLTAASLMRQHLEGSRRKKVVPIVFEHSETKAHPTFD